MSNMCSSQNLRLAGPRCWDHGVGLAISFLVHSGSMVDKTSVPRSRDKGLSPSTV